MILKFHVRIVLLLFQATFLLYPRGWMSSVIYAVSLGHKQFLKFGANLHEILMYDDLHAKARKLFYFPYPIENIH